MFRLLFIGALFTLGLGANAQLAPSFSTQNVYSAFAFGDAWGAGNSLHFAACVDASCVQQRYFSIDSPTNGYAGMYSSMQTPPDGKPFLTYAVYFAPNRYELRSLKCGNELCSQGNVMSIITNDASRERTNIQFQPGTSFPAWVYGDYATDTSYFVQCTNENCSQRTQHVIGKTSTQQITNQWVFSADETPLIATLAGKILSCRDARCTKSPTEISLSTVRAHQGNTVRMILPSDGKPVITSMNTGTNPNSIDFFITKCIDKKCKNSTTTLAGNWIKPVWAEHDHDIMLGSDGLPAVVYQSGPSPQLNFLHCSTSDCTTSTTHVIAANSGTMTGRHSTATIGPNGMPIIAHHNMQDLYYVHCADVACSTPAQNYVSIIRSNAGNHVTSTRV